VIHKLRGRISNRKTDEKVRGKAIRILSREVYRDFGPTLASEYLSSKHGIAIGREALRQVMISAGLWRARSQKTAQDHQWRKRGSCRGELIQWDTSEHDWLEGRGQRLYLIHMIDDATSELTARFVCSDSTEENMRLLWRYLERHGPPGGVLYGQLHPVVAGHIKYLKLVDLLQIHRGLGVCRPRSRSMDEFEAAPVMTNGATVVCCFFRKGVTAFKITALKPELASDNFPRVCNVP
jgi:hypothetical protein